MVDPTSTDWATNGVREVYCHINVGFANPVFMLVNHAVEPPEDAVPTLV